MRNNLVISTAVILIIFAGVIGYVFGRMSVSPVSQQKLISPVTPTHVMVTTAPQATSSAKTSTPSGTLTPTVYHTK